MVTTGEKHIKSIKNGAESLLMAKPLHPSVEATIPKQCTENCTHENHNCPWLQKMK
jgi:hypothetical protein